MNAFRVHAFGLLFSELMHSYGSMRCLRWSISALECDACNGWCHLRCQKGTQFVWFRNILS